MHEFLRHLDVATWIPIVISAISLVYTIIKNYYSDKRLKHAEKINEENYNWKKNFDIYKEENRQKDILIQNSLILEIGFINIGKESATNIQLVPKFPDEGLQGYIYSEGYPKKVYYINEYLSQYYATTREKVTFKVKVELKNEEKINDFFRFKIKYSDLIGNEYEQEFRCGFYMLDCIAYNLNNTSYKPILLKK